MKSRISARARSNASATAPCPHPANRSKRTRCVGFSFIVGPSGARLAPSTSKKSRTPLTTTRMLPFGPTLPARPDLRNLYDMRRVVVDARTKSQRFVEACRRGIVRSQPEVVEAAAGCRDDVRHQPSGHPESAEVRQHVEMPDPADTLVARIRIDVESADTDQAASDPRAEQRLARPVEPIRPVVPFVDEPTNEPGSRPLALRD